MHCVISQKNCIRSYNTYLFTVTTRKCNALKHMTNSWSQYYNAFELVTIISEKMHYNVRYEYLYNALYVKALIKVSSKTQK